MTNRVMVHYVQEEAIDATINTIHEVEEKMNDIDKRLRDGYRTRIVTNQNSLREKALIFKCGLDDRVIELMKLFMVSHLQESDKNLQIEEFLFSGQNKESASFAVNTGEQGWGSVAFAVDFYDHIAEHFKDAIATDKAVIVDQKWALDLFRNLPK